MGQCADAGEDHQGQLEISPTDLIAVTNATVATLVDEDRR